MPGYSVPLCCVNGGLLFDHRILWPALAPLPASRFTFGEWKHAKVNIDYHIDVEGHYYSVPCKYAREQVDVRVTRATVEIFHRGQRLASQRGAGGTSQCGVAQSHRRLLFYVAPLGHRSPCGPGRASLSSTASDFWRRMPASVSAINAAIGRCLWQGPGQRRAVFSRKSNSLQTRGW